MPYRDQPDPSDRPSDDVSDDLADERDLFEMIRRRRSDQPSTDPETSAVLRAWFCDQLEP